MPSPAKKFHFQEINWTISFLPQGNNGKYSNYLVSLSKENQPAIWCKLSEIMENAVVEQHYPHTVGYYKAYLEQPPKSNPDYLEIRRINFVEEFWLFLNRLDI